MTLLWNGSLFFIVLVSFAVADVVSGDFEVRRCILPGCIVRIFVCGFSKIAKNANKNFELFCIECSKFLKHFSEFSRIFAFGFVSGNFPEEFVVGCIVGYRDPGFMFPAAGPGAFVVWFRVVFLCEGEATNGVEDGELGAFSRAFSVLHVY